MNNKNILVLGDGLLGSEMVKQTGWDYLSRKKDNLDLDFLLEEPYYPTVKKLSILDYAIKSYDTIVNCIAYTDTRNNSPEKHIKINYKFSHEIANLCKINRKKLIFISTDYVYSFSAKPSLESYTLFPPNNWYGYTKALADMAIQNLNGLEYLITRCSFKPNPYPYEYAWDDLIGNFDYVDVIAKIIIDLINGNATGVYNVGTKSKNLFDLAKQTKMDVKIDLSPNKTDRPYNITMNLSKLNNFYAKFHF
jgi:dTDP-4-dehydrorhamnose reductase